MPTLIKKNSQVDAIGWEWDDSGHLWYIIKSDSNPEGFKWISSNEYQVMLDKE